MGHGGALFRESGGSLWRSVGGRVVGHPVSCLKLMTLVGVKDGLEILILVAGEFVERFQGGVF
ncbi:MAG: hypothetical protein QOH34_1141 [Mycobacterium sp.]|jgi:hypothetical protein|nr:hypothetical protein [Mycobacterium sp.]